MDIFYLYVQSDLFGVFRLTSALMGLFIAPLTLRNKK